MNAVVGSDLNPLGALTAETQLVDGTSLTQKSRGGPLPASDAFMLAAQVAQALEAAHREQIVHRDASASPRSPGSAGDAQRWPTTSRCSKRSRPIQRRYGKRLAPTPM